MRLQLPSAFQRGDASGPASTRSGAFTRASTAYCDFAPYSLSRSRICVNNSTCGSPIRDMANCPPAAGLLATAGPVFPVSDLESHMHFTKPYLSEELQTT